MVTSVNGVFTKHSTTWQEHGAFAEGVAEVAGKLNHVEELTQVIVGSAGATAAKKLAGIALNIAACEVKGAVASYASDSGDAQLAAQVAYGNVEVTKGNPGDVVARCRNIHDAATANLAALAKYGITAAKLTALEQKIAAFDTLKVAPRDSVIVRRAARAMREKLVRSAGATLRNKLDRLVVQFKAANPTFYEEYFAARVVVDMRNSHATNTDVQATAPATPAPAPAHA